MSKTKTIPCQDIHDENGGCYTCGGYGVVMVNGEACSKCNAKAWFRPGNHTFYDGKKYKSSDGLQLTWHPGGTLCYRCEPKDPPCSPS